MKYYIIFITSILITRSVYTQPFNNLDFKVKEISIPNDFIIKGPNGQTLKFFFAADLHGGKKLPSLIGLINATSTEELEEDSKYKKSIPLIFNGDLGGGRLKDDAYDNRHIYTVFKEYANLLFSNVGNHDTDTKKKNIKTAENFQNNLKEPEAPVFVSANIYVKETAKFLTPEQVIKTKINGRNIFFLPIIGEELFTNESAKELGVVSPEKTIDIFMDYLKRQGYKTNDAPVVILLHGSVDEQKRLVNMLSNPKYSRVIALLGSHEHRYIRVKAKFPSEPIELPYYLDDVVPMEIPIFNAEWNGLSFIPAQAGDALYQLSLAVPNDKTKKATMKTTGSVNYCCGTQYVSDPDPLVTAYLDGNGKTLKGEPLPLPPMIDSFEKLNLDFDLPVGYSAKDIPYSRKKVLKPLKDGGCISNPAINIVLDALLNTAFLDVYDQDENKITPDIAIMNATSIRYGFKEGEYITSNDIMSLTPFENVLYIAEIKGSKLENFLKSIVNLPETSRRYFFKGVDYTILNGELVLRDINPNKVYKVLMTSYDALYNKNITELISGRKYKINPKKSYINPNGDFYVFQYIYWYMKNFLDQSEGFIKRENSGKIVETLFVEAYFNDDKPKDDPSTIEDLALLSAKKLVKSINPKDRAKAYLDFYITKTLDNDMAISSSLFDTFCKPSILRLLMSI